MDSAIPRITSYAFRHQPLTFVVFTFLLGLGIRAFLTTPRYESPIVQPPGAGITVVFPGASPEDMEELVVRPLEKELYELEEIDRLTSTMKEGISTTAIEFDFGTDPDEKFDEVQEKVNSVRTALPSGVQRVEVIRRSTADAAIFQWALTSRWVSYRELYQEAERLQKALEKVAGLKAVTIDAYPETVVKVAINPTKLVAGNLSVFDVENALKAANTNVPTGTVQLSDHVFGIYSKGAFGSVDDIANTIVDAREGRITHVKDIATVKEEESQHKYRGQYRGKRALVLYAQMNEGVNIFTVAGPVKAVVEDFTFKNDMALVTVYDQSALVAQSINDFLINLLQGILLVGGVIVFALGVRPALLVMLAIPLSVFTGIWVIDLGGYGLQQVSIAGLVIALGLLVDNAMAVVENIERYRHLGLGLREAALKGTGELVTPLMSATLTTCLAFLPIILMPDKSGAFIASMPVTVIATLSGSLLIAVALTPLLAFHLQGRKKQAANLKTWFSRHMDRFIEGPYDRLLKGALKRKWRVLSGVGLLFVLTLLLATSIPRTYFPDAEKPMFRILISLPEGKNLQATHRVVQHLEKHLDTIPQIRHYVSNTGHGNPRVFFTAPAKSAATNFAEILVVLHEYQPETFYALMARLQDAFSQYPGADIDVKPYVQGVSSDAPVVLHIQGDNLRQLKSLAARVENIFIRVPGAINIENELGQSVTGINVNIRREKAALLGLNTYEIDKTVRIFVHGTTVGQFLDEAGEEYDIILGYKHPDSLTLADFEDILVQSPTGALIPLTQLAGIGFGPVANKITHRDKERSASISADIAPGYTLDKVVRQLKAEIQTLDWQDCAYTFGGELEQRNKSFGNMGEASLIALTAIFLVLIVQFRSVAQPFIILTALPLALIGSVCALFVFQASFSFMAIVGLISLIGIAINDSIILVDFANRDRRDGKTVFEAVNNAAKIRLVPVLLTSVTTIMGLLPLTLLGGNLWKPMGLVIMGGLTTSTVLVLVVVPCLYLVFTKNKPN